MPRRPRPLPSHLVGVAFTTQRAVASGVDKKRLRALDLQHPFRGIHVGVDPAMNLMSRCAAYLVRMPPGGFFCGPTAALIQGVPLPAGLERSPDLHVAVPSPRRAVRRAGIVGHRFALGASGVRSWRGLPVTDPARTWRDLARSLSYDDLVAAGDYLLHGDLPLATRSELEAEAAAALATGARGARALARALPLLDGRSESRMETRLRLILIRAGITGIEPNFWVTLRRPRASYRIDIAFPQVSLGLEYQSEYHHEIEQWRSDMTRLARLRAAGWTMIEVSARDLDDPGELGHRIRMLVSPTRGDTSDPSAGS